MKYIGSAITAAVILLLLKFMAKDNAEDNSNNTDTIILDCKKNVKTIMYIIGSILILLFPIITIIIFIKDNTINTELLILDITFFILGLFILIGMKYQKIVYKNGIFIKNNIFGKQKKYKLEDATKIIYEKDFFETIILFFDKNKKLEITSYLTNVKLIINEIKSKNIEIDNYDNK